MAYTRLSASDRHLRRRTSGQYTWARVALWAQRSWKYHRHLAHPSGDIWRSALNYTRTYHSVYAHAEERILKHDLSYSVLHALSVLSLRIVRAMGLDC